MIAIMDILVYVAFAFFAHSIARKSETYIIEADKNPAYWDKYLTYFVLFYTVIGGVRWNVGCDSISYATIFDHGTQDFEDNKELLWKYTVLCFQSLDIHWMFGLALCAFIQIFFITKSLQTFRWLLVFMPFVFFGGRYWMDTMNAVRQMIVACGFLWASRFIFDKKLIHYALFIFVGSLIHQSALILAPFFFLPNRLQIENKRLVLSIILIGCVIIGQTPAFQGFAGYVQMIAGVANYEDKIDSLTEILMTGQNDESLAFGPMMLSYVLIPLFVIWYGPLLKEEYADKIPYFSLWYNLAYIYACGYFLLCNVGHYFIRPVMYFSMFQMVMATMLLRYLWVRFKHEGIGQIACLTFCIVIATNTAWDVYKASSFQFESSTYKVSFLYPEQKKWFNL